MTSDAATIIREIEVVHPAAKLLVMASQAQEAEVCFSFFFFLLQKFSRRHVFRWATQPTRS